MNADKRRFNAAVLKNYCNLTIFYKIPRADKLQKQPQMKNSEK